MEFKVGDIIEFEDGYFKGLNETEESVGVITKVGDVTGNPYEFFVWHCGDKDSDYGLSCVRTNPGEYIITEVRKYWGNGGNYELLNRAGGKFKTRRRSKTGGGKKRKSKKGKRRKSKKKKKSKTRRRRR